MSSAHWLVLLLAFLIMTNGTPTGTVTTVFDITKNIFWKQANYPNY